jgi:TonB family protein
MKVRVRTAAAAAGMVWLSTLAQADFQAAFGQYQAGNYDVAHRQFLALAELGDCSSQFNLGAMTLKGQGVSQDTGSGVGWLQAAASNGCQQLVGEKLTALAARLTPDQAKAAQAVLARYGHEALLSEGILNPPLACSNITPPTVLDAPKPEYPPSDVHQDGIVIAALTIGVDGRARDPEILQSVPNEHFAAAAIDAWLNWRYVPAKRNGQPVEARVQTKWVFTIQGAGPLADAPAFKQARPAASAGDAAAEYLVGLTSTLDDSLGVSAAQGGQLLLAAARDGDPQAQYWLGSQLRTTAECHPHADGGVWLRHAAEAGNASAQLLLAHDLLGAGAASAQVAEARALLEKAASSDSYYVRKHVAAVLATSALEGLRDPATALAVAKRLAAGEIQGDPQMLEVLAAAQAANGDYREAVAQQERALQRAYALGWNTTAMADRLSAYRAARPWHGDLFAA